MSTKDSQVAPWPEQQQNVNSKVTEQPVNKQPSIKRRHTRRLAAPTENKSSHKQHSHGKHSHGTHNNASGVSPSASSHSDSGSESGSGSESEDDKDVLPVQTLTNMNAESKRFCKEYGQQCATITKTATAIVIALLWSSTVTTLMDCIFSTFNEEGHYKLFSFWTGWTLISVLVLSIIPVISFKYVKTADFWAITLLIEILGHLWGFKVKDIVTEYSYRIHYLKSIYSNISAAPTITFCNIGPWDVNTSRVDGTFVTSRDMGFLGYNLDWGNYTYDRSIVDDYYPYSNNARTLQSENEYSLAPTPAPERRNLAEVASLPTPAPYGGPKIDVDPDSSGMQVGPGQVCSFEYKTVTSFEGFRVQKIVRTEYLIELGYRILIWVGMIAVVLSVVSILRLIYNKFVFRECCKKKMNHAMRHNYTHIQNHLIADSFANGMGWVSAWLIWWIVLIVIMTIANLGNIFQSACNGMHAFPLATVLFALGVFFLLVYTLQYGRRVCWGPLEKKFPGVKIYVGGVGELQNGFLLGWYLVILTQYFYAVYLGIYFEAGRENYNPFDDVVAAHPSPTPELALEEISLALLWTLLGVTYLTSQSLKLHDAHRETELLQEAKRRLQKYFALTRTFDGSNVAEDIKELINLRKARSRAMEQRAAIVIRAFGVWLGLTIELAIHMVIELIDSVVLCAYNDERSCNDNDSYISSGYGSYYNYNYNYNDYYGTVDYTPNAINNALILSVHFSVSAVLTGVFFLFMFFLHHCSWRISTEKQRSAATKLQAVHRGRASRKALMLKKNVKQHASSHSPDSKQVVSGQNVEKKSSVVSQFDPKHAESPTPESFD
jgi:hypothetical protein